MRRLPSELTRLFSLLRMGGYTVRTIRSPYDQGPLPSLPASHLHREVTNSDAPVSTWWIGLSLGASIAHIVASTISPPKKPKRLTLINPFSDRVALSQIKGFELGDQWPIAPCLYDLPSMTFAEIVLSSDDTQIPNDQGMRLHVEWGSMRSRVITIDGDHSLSAIKSQEILAKALLEM